MNDWESLPIELEMDDRHKLKNERLIYAYVLRAPRLCRVSVVRCTAPSALARVGKFIGGEAYAGFMTHLYVAQPYRERGIGEALVRAAVDQARVRALPLVTYAQPFDNGGPDSNVLHRLYRRCGFRSLRIRDEPGWLFIGAKNERA